VASYLTAPVVDGAADWGRAVRLPETGDLWRRRAALWRGQRDRLRLGVGQMRSEQRITRLVAVYALKRLLKESPVPRQGVDRVRAYLAGERRLP
jgi:hypothetical protein